MGVVHGCHMFVPAMVERGRGGHVVNLSCRGRFRANPSLAAYTATKFAVLGLSEALRIELRPLGIGVTADARVDKHADHAQQSSARDR